MAKNNGGKKGSAGKKKMTHAQLKAIDWSSLITKLSPIALLFLKALVDSLMAQPKPAMKGVGKDEACCEELCTACDEECDALAELVTKHLALHELIKGDDEDDEE